LTSAQAYALISNPTAISMMTGVFHFMVVSLSLMSACPKLRLPRGAVNRQPDVGVERIFGIRSGGLYTATSRIIEGSCLIQDN
jgi:hypothetical protein